MAYHTEKKRLKKAAAKRLGITVSQLSWDHGVLHRTDQGDPVAVPGVEEVRSTYIDPYAVEEQRRRSESERWAQRSRRY